MDKTIALVILIGGILLVIFALTASDSIISDISKAFTDSPTDKSMWMLVGGIVVTGIGLAGVLRGSRS